MAESKIIFGILIYALCRFQNHKNPVGHIDTLIEKIVYLNCLFLFLFVFYSSPDSAVQPPVSPSVLAKTPKKVPAVWKGFVMMQSVAKFGTSAYRVSGPCDDLLQLLPDTLHVQGRIAHEQVWDYLLQLKSSTSRVRVVEVIFQKRVRVFQWGFQIRG